MKEMLDFLNDLAFDSYMHLSSNLKLEMFENFFQTLKTVSDYKVSSLKVIKKNYVYENLYCNFEEVYMFIWA